MASDDVLGSLSLTEPFDFCIIGSGAGGGTAAHVLTAAGESVLVLEAGHNPLPRLEPHDPALPLDRDDGVKHARPRHLPQGPLLQPRGFPESRHVAGPLDD